MRVLSIFFLIIFITASCNTGNQATELGDGYFFRLPGNKTKDILNHKPNHKDIPANIEKMNFDRNFIIALQRPQKVDNSIYNNSPEYPYGSDTLYYWLVIKKLDLVLGPLSKREYENERIIYMVPEDLKLKSSN